MSTPDSVLDRDTLGAFCRHTHVAMPGAPHGRLHGLTFGVKDIYDVAGTATGFGNPDWMATHDIPATTSSVVTRLLEAGATLVGKTHTEEMAFSLTGENAHYGTPVNPAAPGRVPGGSSSGSAAAVAGELVDFAIGSDTGGSVRAPASFCGIYGIRPTHGRIPLDGVLPLAPGFDTCSWFARDAAILGRVGDTLLAESATTGLRAPGKLLYARDAFAHARPAVAKALLPLIRSAEALLDAAERVTVSLEGLDEWYDVFRTIQYDEIWRTHGPWIERTRPRFGAQMQTRFEAVRSNDASRLPWAQARRAEIRARLDALLGGNAILLMPTVPDIAPLTGLAPAETVAFREHALQLLCVAGLGGLPQISVPAGTVDRAPVGLSLVAARGNDEMLLAFAEQLARSTNRRA